MWIVTRYHSGKELISKYFGSSGLIHPQIRSTWVPANGSCTVRNIESNKATIISMFINDFFLLVVMLVGLLRMRVRCGGTFALGRLLCKQVRWRQFLHANGHGSLIPLI